MAVFREWFAPKLATISQPKTCVTSFAGVLALGRLQAQSDPKLSAVAQSLELSGTGKTVSLSFTVPAELLDMAMSHAQGAPRPHVH